MPMAEASEVLCTACFIWATTKIGGILLQIEAIIECIVHVSFLTKQPTYQMILLTSLYTQ